MAGPFKQKYNKKSFPFKSSVLKDYRETVDTGHGTHNKHRATEDHYGDPHGPKPTKK